MGMPPEYEPYFSTAALPLVLIGTFIFWYRRYQYPIVDRMPWLCIFLSLMMVVWYGLSKYFHITILHL
jgi:hypothetical protein